MKVDKTAKKDCVQKTGLILSQKENIPTDMRMKLLAKIFC